MHILTPPAVRLEGRHKINKITAYQMLQSVYSYTNAQQEKGETA
jgi:hypothetical protein